MYASPTSVKLSTIIHKTINLMKKLIQKLGVAAVMLLTFFSAMAYDFEYDGLYYNILSTADLTCEVVSGDSPYTATSVTIPAKVAYKGRELTVTRIVEAFKGCTSLASVTIPNSVTKIYDYAFSGCTSLASVTIPNSVTYIGRSAFGSCKSLASVTLPNSVTEIGQYAFSGCTSLASVTLSNSVTSIGYGTFSGCTSLVSITIPNSVTEIGNSAFSDCTSLASVTMSNSMTEIKKNTFWGCSNLASIIIPASINYICEDAFGECATLSSISFEYSSEVLNLNYVGEKTGKAGKPSFPMNTYENIIINRDISYAQFEGQDVYLKSRSLTFRDFSCVCTTTGSYRLHYADGHFFRNWNIILGSVDILMHLTLGKDVANVPGDMTPCGKLETITLTTPEPPTCPSFSNLQYTDIVVYVPKGSLETYQTAKGWKNFWDIRESEAAGIGDAQVSAEEKTVVGRYDLQGRPVSDSYSGMVVVRYSDGSVRKVMR